MKYESELSGNVYFTHIIVLVSLSFTTHCENKRSKYFTSELVPPVPIGSPRPAKTKLTETLTCFLEFSEQFCKNPKKEIPSLL